MAQGKGRANKQNKKENSKLTIAPVVKALASASSFMIMLTQGNRIGVMQEVIPKR